jgi:hypothetical protein
LLLLAVLLVVAAGAGTWGRPRDGRVAWAPLGVLFAAFVLLGLAGRLAVG